MWIGGVAIPGCEFGGCGLCSETMFISVQYAFVSVRSHVDLLYSADNDTGAYLLKWRKPVEQRCLPDTYSISFGVAAGSTSIVREGSWPVGK